MVTFDKYFSLSACIVHCHSSYIMLLFVVRPFFHCIADIFYSLFTARSPWLGLPLYLLISAVLRWADPAENE
jgi:hypothetical protein